MDFEYLKDHICEELEGAKDYAMRAIELKPMAATWAKMLIEMATAELNHAAYLHKMLVEYYQKIAATYTEVPDYIETSYQETCRCYTSNAAEAKYIIDMYSK